MKTIAALIAGLLLSTITFVAGLAIALTLLNIDEPEHKLDSQNTAALWSTEPVVVNKANQSFERVAPRPGAKTTQVASLDKTASAKTEVAAAKDTGTSIDTAAIDPMTTSSVDPQQKHEDDGVRQAQVAAHLQWCSRRYRSYNAESNTYRPYGGGRRVCQSPYSEFVAGLPAGDRTTAVRSLGSGREIGSNTAERAPVMEQASYEEATAAYPDDEHIRACFERYRSYRPEDNSYQPYDGGPRQQCQ